MPDMPDTLAISPPDPMFVAMDSTVLEMLTMHYRLDIKGWRFYIAITHSQQLHGVNSQLGDDYHFLMWDFDNVELGRLFEELEHIQWLFELPAIHILQSSLPNSYHAYCFARRPWGMVLQILATTQYIDQQFFKIGVIRGYFTLRIEDKKAGLLKAVGRIPSLVDNEVGTDEITSFANYWTSRL